MLRRALIFAALPLIAGGPALASSKPKEGEPQQDVGQYVDLAPVALPIVVGGKLVNYVFVYVRIVLTSNANTSKIRMREPYFRDALVRAAHRTPFTDPKDYQTIDGPKMQATLMREAVALVGPGNIKGVIITSQTPKTRVQPPGGGARGGRGEIHP